jgi:hypothetical protein
MMQKIIYNTHSDSLPKIFTKQPKSKQKSRSLPREVKEGTRSWKEGEGNEASVKEGPRSVIREDVGEMCVDRS